MTQPESASTSSPTGTVNLEQLEQKYHVSVKNKESPEETSARLEIEKAKSKHERNKELIKLLSFLVFAAAILAVCLLIVSDRTYSADDKKWSTSIITLILGYFIGAKTQKE